MRSAGLSLALILALASPSLGQVYPSPQANVEAPTSFGLKAFVRLKVNATVGKRGWTPSVRVLGSRAIARAFDKQIAAAPSYPQTDAGWQRWIDDTGNALRSALGSAGYPGWHAAVLGPLSDAMNDLTTSGRIKTFADEIAACREISAAFKGIDR